MKKTVYVAMPDGDVRNSFVDEGVRAHLESCFQVRYNPSNRQLTQEQLRQELMDCDAVLTGWSNALINEDVLAGNDRLKLIIHTGGTVGNYVDESTYDHGVTVLTGNRLYAESVAEGTVAYMLMGLRQLPDYVQLMRDGGWKKGKTCWNGLLDRTVGIVGLSTISRILIRMLQPFRVKCKVFTHHGLDPEFAKQYNCQQASLEEIFSTCSVVSVHSALNNENRGLIRKEHFDLLQDGALFINTSRGEVLDEDALIEALKEKRFRAVLDVYTKEPPLADSYLRLGENVYPMPHMAGPTTDRRPYITHALIDEACRFFDGERDLSLEIDRNTARRMTKM